jgi:N-acetylmuramoyl-L-alanine amidase
MKFLFGLLFALAASLGMGQTVCIDPGHPSEVGVGTRGKKLTEVGVAWDVAKALQIRLRREGLDVLLTKTSQNQVVRNKRRAEIANEANAALMIRLHCDASNGSGFAVYYPAKTGTVDKVTGPDPEVLEWSHTAAAKFHNAMVAALKGKLHDEGLKTDAQTAVGGKQGALTGSIYSKVPVVLVEMVVLTNPKDEAFMASKTGREAMVEALAKGVLAVVRKE